MLNVTLFSGGTGINNKVPPERLRFNLESGVSAFEDAADVIVGKSGDICTIRANSEVFTGDYHSLFASPDGSEGFVAVEDSTGVSLMEVVASASGDISLRGVWSGLEAGKRVSWTYGNAGQFFYANGSAKGVISGGVRSAWPISAWENDQTTVGFEAVPDTANICYFAGRMFFTQNDNGRFLLSWTEYNHLGLYDPAISNREFESECLLMVGVADGLYVSDENNIWFLSGLNPTKFSATKVTSYPAKEFGLSCSLVNPVNFGFESSAPTPVIATENGPVLLMPGGSIINLIEKNVSIPKCKRTGALIIVDETLVIQTTEED